MHTLFFIFLALHLLGVVLAYGTTLLVPFLAPAGAAPNAADTGGAVARWARLLFARFSLPAAVSMPVTGAGMVIVAGINPATHFWLWFSIVLYLASLVYLVIRHRPRIARLVRGQASPEVRRQAWAATAGLGAVILVIGVLMMTKPGA
ncbi:MAG: DUF2269 domain-containing protein [Candidatus Dormibacteraeota bacterium]|nr:DUF2269 domain-containing protein [Candidatus Dormibacteraeota bacterium]